MARREALGPRHLDTLGALNNVATVLHLQGAPLHPLLPHTVDTRRNDPLWCNQRPASSRHGYRG